MMKKTVLRIRVVRMLSGISTT